VVKLLVEHRRRSATLSPDEPADGRRYSANGNQPSQPLQTLADDVAKDLVRLFKLLSDATRLRIIYFLLQQQEFHVRALCELLGQSQPAVSHHLSLLRAAGLIESRRQGKHNFYRLLPDGLDEVLSFVAARMKAEGR